MSLYVSFTYSLYLLSHFRHMSFLTKKKNKQLMECPSYSCTCRSDCSEKEQFCRLLLGLQSERIEYNTTDHQ